MNTTESSDRPSPADNAGQGPQERPDQTAGVTPSESPGDSLGPLARADSRRRMLPWLVALLMTCVAVVFASMWAPLYSEARAREAVRDTATELVLHLVTFRGEDIDAWVARTQEMATGEYADQVAALFDQELRDALRDAEAESVGTLVDLFVQDVAGDQATVFAVVRQTIRNAATDTPAEDELRIQLTMVESSDGWLASNVEVLGPSGLGTPTLEGEG